MLGLALILILGVCAEVLAWRIRVPSILMLLVFGFLAGPVFHWIDPGRLLGDLLQPVVSLSVALILFEGGMSLRLSELRQSGRVVRNLVSVGAVATAVITAVAAHLILNLPWQLSSLLGALLMVTGPTVIGPLLRHVRPVGELGPILKWEGIVLDPIGAISALLVFEAVRFGAIQSVTPVVVGAALRTLAVGTLLGLGFAGALLLLFRRHWVPDYLHNPLTLSTVAASFVASNFLQHESGLFTVTVMGIAIANQRSVAVRHIAEFKETLSTLLIASLFIVLSARLDLTTIIQVGWRGLAFLASLILLARPASVALSTQRSGLNRRQKLFLSAMAPRGVVAAAVSSVFALRLRATGVPGAQFLVPVTFIVIIGTVLVYGLAAAPLGRRLGLAWPNAQGCLIIGAHALGRAIGNALREAGCPVLLVDTNYANIRNARLDGLPTYLGSIVTQNAQENIELSSIGRLLAMTSNDEVNSLAALSLARTFGRSEVYQLPPANAGRKQDVSQELRGRLLFGAGLTYDALMDRLNAGAVIKQTPITEEFGLPQFQQHYGDRAVLMFLLSPTGELQVFTDEDPAVARPGQTLISLALPAPSISRAPIQASA